MCPPGADCRERGRDPEVRYSGQPWKITEIARLRETETVFKMFGCSAYLLLDVVGCAKPLVAQHSPKPL